MDAYALIDIPRTAVENMAIDLRMLQFAAKHQCLLLRIYRWSEPTLSLGYFQKYAERDAHEASSRLAVVRRATGGGAIVHHFDWTYCVVVPEQLLATTRSSAQPRQPAAKIGASQPLYDGMHDAVVAWLGELGIAAAKWSTDCQSDPLVAAVDNKCFLCFERRSCGDVVIEAHKVMGSAQRRLQGALLQHGSLLLASSEFTPSLCGIWDLASARAAMKSGVWLDSGDPTSDSIQIGIFFEHLKNALQSMFGVPFRVADSMAEMPLEWSWPIASKFADQGWTQRL